MSSPKDGASSIAITREQLSRLRHDLRTPINQIIGYNELVQDVAEDEGYDGIRNDLENVNTAARNLLTHLENCMNDMLAVPGGEAVDLPGKQTATSDGDVVIPSAPDKDAPLPRAETALRILVVDDNEMNRDMLGRRLHRQGYEVSTANDGYQALEQAKAQRFDALLLDVMMPGISGLDVLSTLRTEHDMTDLPIIMATAQNASEEIVRALELGANDYVTKPIDFPVVLARLGTHLKLKAAAQEIRELAADLERNRDFIRNVFGRYLSDDVVESLLDEPAGLELGGQSREITVLMSDLRGFSSMCERIAPEDVVRLLNLYLERMTEVILRHGGTIDEFIGDAILVVFGAPKALGNHAETAVVCALEMQQAMDGVNAAASALGLPEIEMGIGINTGTVVVGNIGSEQRAKYGVIGRTVNLAARIESYTIGGQVLISDATASQVQAQLDIDATSTVSPKGCRGSLQIHSISGVGGEHGISLGGTADERTELDQHIDLVLGALDGVNVPNLGTLGKLVSVSPREFEIEVEDDSLQLLTNVAIELADPAPHARIYAKVIEIETGLVSRGTLRLSSIPDRVRKWLQSIG